MNADSLLPSLTGEGSGEGPLIMKESTKKTVKTVLQFIVTVITALLTTIGAHAANLVK